MVRIADGTRTRTPTTPDDRAETLKGAAFSDCPEGQTRHNHRGFSIDDTVRCQRIQQIALFLARAVFVGQTCAIGAFEEFGDLFAGVAFSVLPACDLSLASIESLAWLFPRGSLRLT